jgi:signal transduction histidine kinase
MIQDGSSPRGLRLALMAGFGGIALIFLFATIDAVRLLGAMQKENKILRDQSVARTNHLASIRSSIMLTHAYFGEYVLDSQRQKDYQARVQESWSRERSDLADYHASTADEEALMERLADMLEQDWQDIDRMMSTPAGDQRAAPPFRISVVDLATRLQNIDTKQAAATEARIQDQFEHLGANLRNLLTLCLASALALAAGCLIYIFRIERQNRRRYEEILKGRKALEQLSARLVDAQETERRTISRDLHDQVGQTLNALLVDAANLAKRIPPEDAVSLRYLNNIRTFADSSVNSIRDIALLLRPSMLDDLGLIPALEFQAREVSRRTGIKVDVTAESVPDALGDDVRTCVYRVAQEALHNMSRHSGATAAAVIVRHEGGSLLLTISDNGHGFDPKRTRGLGMLGMEERIRHLEGTFEIQSEPGKGTTLRVSLPVEAAAVRVQPTG